MTVRFNDVSDLNENQSEDCSDNTTNDLENEPQDPPDISPDPEPHLPYVLHFKQNPSPSGQKQKE